MRTPTRFSRYSKKVLPIALLRVAPLVAALKIMTAVLPNGDIERAVFRPVANGVESVVELQSAETGLKSVRRQLLPLGRYGWRIEEEHRSVLMAAPGRPTGTVRRAFLLSAWVDATPSPNAPPNPVEAFHFYAPTREVAEALRDQLKADLAVKR